MSDQKSKFKHWCIVELFGHSKIAGHCTEENIAGCNMLRVDVPETKLQPPFTKYYGAAAIYAINPVDETTATLAAEGIQMAPVQTWQADSFIEKVNANKTALPASSKNETEDDDDDDDDSFI